MSKITLQDSFKEFCEQNKLEVNASQTEIINSLDNFLNYKEGFIKLFSEPKIEFLSFDLSLEWLWLVDPIAGP